MTTTTIRHRPTDALKHAAAEHDYTWMTPERRYPRNLEGRGPFLYLLASDVLSHTARVELEWVPSAARLNHHFDMPKYGNWWHINRVTGSSWDGNSSSTGWNQRQQLSRTILEKDWNVLEYWAKGKTRNQIQVSVGRFPRRALYKPHQNVLRGKQSFANL
jgi:hypothetical protein